MQSRSARPLAVPANAVATLPEPAMLAGLVDRVLFHNPAGPYTVALLNPDAGDRPVSVTGSFPEVRPGEYLRCSGRWEVHARFGRQFRATAVTLVLPASAEGIRRYLSSPFVKGIGPVTARRLVEHFSLNTLEALDAGTDRLLEVPGIGRIRAGRISASWQQHQALREVMLMLFDLGISYRRAEQLYQHFGALAPLVVRRDPYRLALEVRGIGFLTADRIAAAAGIPADDPGRIQAGLLYCVQAATIAGHTWLPMSRLWEEGEALLAKRASPPVASATAVPLTQAHMERSLAALMAKDKLSSATVGGETALALQAIDVLERGLAAALVQLAIGPAERMPFWSQLDAVGWEQEFAQQGTVTSRLSAEQRTAVGMALTQRVAVLTGGPGTGKTTAMRALVTLALEHGARIALAAPTGRAARRLAEATGLEARTIHRLIGRRFGGAAADDAPDAEELGQADRDDDAIAGATSSARRRRGLLSADLIIIDEASMLDLPLARALVRRLPAGAHLLLVGDADQLPSVGPGQVLADIITSGRFPVARLQRIFRQGEGSGIAANAQRINAGDMPIWEPGLGSNDFYLFNAEDPATCRRLVLDLVTRRIPTRFGLSGSAIQVLAPMHRGPVGLTTLNPELQDALNPPASSKAELVIGPRVLRLGDRVVQSRNNYDLGVFNGDTGSIIELDTAAYTARVRLDDGRELSYPPAAVVELHLAYALSIHRAQGSEFPVVVLPVVTGQFILLSRRLLYTAVTRAQRLVVLVGHSRAVSFAVRDAGSEDRLTALAERLVNPPSLPGEAVIRRTARRGSITQPSLL